MIRSHLGPAIVWSPPPDVWPPSRGRHRAYHGRSAPGNPDRRRGSVAARRSIFSFVGLSGGAPVSLTCPSNGRRRLLASLERCGRKGIRFSESAGFLLTLLRLLLTLLRRVLLLLSFFGFPRLVAHGAPPVVRVSNERIGCVQQYHLRHASGQRGIFSRSEPSRGRVVSVRSRSRLASHIAGQSPRTHDKRKCGQTRPTPSWSRGYLAAQRLAGEPRPAFQNGFTKNEFWRSTGRSFSWISSPNGPNHSDGSQPVCGDGFGPR